MVAMALVVSVCGLSFASKASASTSAVKSAKAAPAHEIGITPTEIHVAVIADVENAIRPGLFQKNIDVVKAWAKIVNRQGGLAGRKVVVDAIDSKLNPNEARNGFINACTSDFALVGSAALLLTDVSDVEGCKNVDGQSIGIPNLAAIAFGPIQLCSKMTYSLTGNPGFCATREQPGPQKFTASVGDARYFLKTFKQLHGVWLYNTDVPTARTTQVPIYQAQGSLGIKTDADGFYGASGTAPQSALIPVVQTIKREGSTFVQSGVTPPSVVALRKEAQIQGVNSVQVWNCAAGCYTPDFITTGGSAVEGTYQIVQTLPFTSEYKLNKTLAKLIAALGGPDKIDSNSLSSFGEALLFQDAVEKVVASGKALNRQALIDQLDKTHEFNGDGIFGTVDIASHRPTPCFAMLQVKGGKWTRVYPKKPGSFDCDPRNVIDYTIPG